MTMALSALDPAQLARLLESDKLVLLPYAEYQALLAQAETLANIRALLAPPGQPAATPWDEWREQMGQWIDERPTYSPGEKRDLKDQIGKIAAESSQGAEMSMSRLEKLINTLAVIGPDVFEVATATLANPLAGLGVALKKIGDRARLERTA
jgi:hypothetical protein